MTIAPDTATVLDILAAHPMAEAVFRSYDTQAGCCLLCQGLFETLSGLATRFDLDREALLSDLSKVIAQEEK